MRACVWQPYATPNRSVRMRCDAGFLFGVCSRFDCLCTTQIVVRLCCAAASVMYCFRPLCRSPEHAPQTRTHTNTHTHTCTQIKRSRIKPLGGAHGARAPMYTFARMYAYIFIYMRSRAGCCADFTRTILHGVARACTRMCRNNVMPPYLESAIVCARARSSSLRGERQQPGGDGSGRRARTHASDAKERTALCGFRCVHVHRDSSGSHSVRSHRQNTWWLTRVAFVVTTTATGRKYSHRSRRLRFGCAMCEYEMRLFQRSS